MEDGLLPFTLLSNLDKEKESELKKLVDEGYDDPAKLAEKLAEVFGL